MHWIIEVELDGGQWMRIAAVEQIDSVSQIVRALTGDHVRDPRAVRVTRLGFPLPPYVPPS